MSVTQIVMLITMVSCALGIVGEDIYMALNNKPGDTFSELWLMGSSKSLTFQVMFGILISHLTSNLGHIYKPSGLITGMIMGMLALIFIGLDIHHWVRPVPSNLAVLRNYPIILINVMMWAGAFIWPQRGVI